MASSAKDLRVAPIAATDANDIIRRNHYSGSYVRNSQLHLGVFLDGRCLGAMQFGPSLDKRKIMPLVRDTTWNGFIELNRMAFSDALPRNSESRALGVAMRLLRKKLPHLQWVVSFADATQCGDGTIYRAAGFTLTGISRNDQIVEFPGGERVTRFVLTKPGEFQRVEIARRYGAKLTGGATLRPFLNVGARVLPGYQLRYIYFLDPGARARLTVPVIPFDRIKMVGASMYRGKSRAGSIALDAPAVQAGEGGLTPTPALHPSLTP